MLTESQQIEAIFQAFPRHVGKRAALKAIENAVTRHWTLNTSREATRRWLWKKAKEYALSPAGQKPQDPAQDFRPHPSTFFNQDRFLDDAAEWQKPNGGKTNGNGKTGSNFDALRESLAADQNGAGSHGLSSGR